MKADLSKVNEILIKDPDNKVVDRFSLGSSSLVKDNPI